MNATTDNARPVEAEAEAILRLMLSEGRHSMAGRGNLIVLAVEMHSDLFRRLAAWDLGRAAQAVTP